jgi:dipeptidyl aminopeptidase/acylaminoacyl peptidase
MTRRHAFLLAILAALPLGALAAQQAPSRHTITHEDVWLAKRLAGLAVSPDGRWAVFSVTEPAYDETRTVSDLWLVPTDGSAEPRRLTNTRAGESGAAWSPDGRRLAFSARREQDTVPQIYVLDLASGGEAQRVTSIATGAGAPRWRPDGQALLFTSEVYPGAASDSANRAVATERRGRKYNVRTYDGFPIRNFDVWIGERRPSLFVQSLEPGARARDLLTGTTLGATGGFGLAGGATWTPDGTGVVFAAATNRDQAAYADVVSALFLVSAAGGAEPRRLTADSADYNSPEFGPEGSALYARMTPNNGRIYNNARLVAWDWPAAGTSRVVTAGFDRSIGGTAYSADGRTIFFSAEDGSHVKLYRVAAAGGPVAEVGQLTTGNLAGFDVGGTAAAPVIAGIWESAVNPPEAVRIDPASGERTLLSRFNVERASRIDWQPVREFTFRSSRGKQIHNMLVVPPAFDSTRTYPLFVVIHGGPASDWLDQFVLRWNYHLLGAPGYVVLLTDYTGSTGYGERFAQEIQGDPLMGPGQEVVEAADEAIRRFHFIDGTKQVAGGASYGGHLSAWLEATTTRFRALIDHAGLVNLESQWGTSDFIYGRERTMGGPHWSRDARIQALWRDQNPIKRADAMRTPMLLSDGEHDFRVPLNNTLEFWSVLQRERVPSRLLVWPDENHWIMRGEDSRHFYEEVHAWIARWLSAPAPGPTSPPAR